MNNSQPETQSPEEIRSEIETTRQRMDNTMDAIGERLHGRHLLDEVIGFFRSSSSGNGTTENSSNSNETMENLKEKAGSALSAVADTVKRNPVPALVIGAGIAWLIYESRRSDRAGDGENYSEEDLPDDFDRPLNYPLTGEENFEAEPSSADKNDFFVEGNGGAGSTLREKVHEARDIVREKIDRAREGASHLRERAGEIGSRVQDRTRELYTRSRDRVAQTANEKPLAVGLGVLALGITVGLALPTPQRVNRIAGPTVDRLRRKVRTAGQDYVERGRRVARAASDAAHGEAQKQGLTFEALRGKTGAGNASQSSSQQAQPQSSPQQQTQPRGESVGRNPSGSGIEGTSPQNMQNDRPSGAPAGASVSAPASDV